jgi:hypothetical protein
LEQGVFAREATPVGLTGCTCAFVVASDALGALGALGAAGELEAESLEQPNTSANTNTKGKSLKYFILTS